MLARATEITWSIAVMSHDVLVYGGYCSLSILK